MPIFKFEDLPILLYETEYKSGGWHRSVKKQRTIADLLKIWDIDDPDEISEIAQVLRHLRRAIELIP